MVRYIREAEVRQILDMPGVVKLVERAFRDRALGKAFDVPRRRTLQPGGSYKLREVPWQSNSCQSCNLVLLGGGQTRRSRNEPS